MSNRQPHHYSRRILLVVIGMTPQIVTETLYKLVVCSDPAFVPTEVHLITTKEGADSARLALLGVEPGQGWFHRFTADFDVLGIRFDEEQIHIIADTEGQFIDDNQSTEHNRVAADFITDRIRTFTSDADSALHVSLAGGRKTMSFYAGYALSLYGRPQDRLSHVLVGREFQNHKDFFYPSPRPKRIEVGNRYYSSEDAQIILSDIPYVRMQQHIPRALLDGKEGFQETVEKIERLNGPATIHFKVAEKELELNGVTVELTDFEYAYYLWLCERARDRKPALAFGESNAMPDFLTVYARIVGKGSARYEHAEDLASLVERADSCDRYHLQANYLGPHRTRLERKLKARLGEKLARPFLIHNSESQGRVAYQISLPPETITIE
ncbi:MAG TPA: TIGR02584 family CRISPR-associated protein [Gammaproteobacteria bacterium]|nr:TIGR02584 family CRISPR-associated protein [Gammaproteobacteria bacterium]